MTAYAADFESAHELVSGVEGWLTRAQALRLFERAADLGAGARVVEIGSFRGRSTIVLAAAAADGVEIVAVDPHRGADRGPREIEPDPTLGDADHETFVANLTRAGVADRVRHLRLTSVDACPQVEGEVDLLYVDGAHRYQPARFDISRWGGRVSGGGTMLVHDAFSSVGVTAALVTTTIFGAGWRYVGRSGSLAEYRRERLGPRERVLNAARQLLALPWFIRNLLVKVLLVAKLGPLTRLLGHTSSEWPY